MNQKDRLTAAFANQPVDRVPFSFWFHFLEDEKGTDGVAHPELLDRIFEGSRRFIQTVQPDFVKIMSDSLFRYPSTIAETFRHPSELRHAEIITSDHPWIRAHVKNALRISHIQENLFYFYNVFSPSYMLHIMTGSEKYDAMFRMDPVALGDGVKRMGEGIQNLIRALMTETDIAGIYYPVSNGNVDLVSDEQQENLFGTADRACLDTANAYRDTSILHICGFEGQRNHVAQWTSYPCKAVNWAVHVENVSLREGKEIFRGKCVVGGFDNTPKGILYTGTEEKIKTETKKILEAAGHTGLVLAADCSLPLDIDYQHLVWVKEALEELR